MTMNDKYELNVINRSNRQPACMLRHRLQASGSRGLVVVLLLLLVSASTHAQQSPRVLAPGVLHTISPEIEEGETVSPRADLIEITTARSYLKWQPQFSPTTRTLFERSQRVPLRRSIWGLEFTFKPFRMIEVDLPQASGKMQRKTLWYMVYRVRYLGEEVHFEKQREALSDGDRYVRFRNTKKDAEFRYFMPYFTLRSHTFAKEYLDRLIPAATDDIAAVEKVDGPILNSIEMSNTKLMREDAETGKGVWGVVVWEDIDPRTNFFSLYIQGLTNAYHYQDTAAAEISKGDPIASGREFEVKTLQLNFYRPGDTIDLVKDTIYYGLPNALPRPEIVYSLEQGDTLKSLARRFLGDENRKLEIYQLNRDIIASPDKLPVGKVVRFPRTNHQHYNDLQPVRLYLTEEGETLEVIASNRDIQLSELRKVNFDKLGLDGEPQKGEYVLLPVTLNRLNRPQPVGSEIYKIYTRRQVQIMRLYGMVDFARNQWLYSSPAPPVFRSGN
ncbi:MAG: LysM peptidoglycan-binding domain-containing protein [Planctomycetaceae bacterium]|jgi:hypothetical protein|nr:LysM peptidoglycan-binding domain-containing protein [Planctomycetaceae bacterium]MBT4726114.1 LysM peptidoglycan-binding domain-containing protein [Planctomycetaceae bacterium]MBT5126569.1 LysM peptidoglycan-binding domain-containing protein [Planctomycetaceae bacterium]MBT5883847.1 LysM peptidoglycan-binding domain-containing protein [Planctomycetaceae bacterium]MBT6847400.1 LysM peptidoglycan-binding domain-containing protein [Planctomycetaceae bacterium]